MSMDELVIAFALTMIILAAVLWNIFQRTAPKPRVAICWKCKYCIRRRRWYIGGVTKTSCRTPKDKRDMNYITGEVYRPTYSCELRNNRGTCPDYKKVWWRL